MKKLYSVLFVLAMMALPIAVFAQVDSTAVVNDPSLGDVINGSGSLLDFFVSLSALLPLVTAIAAWVNKRLNPSGWMKQLVSWVVSLLLCYGAWMAKIGLFTGLDWWVVAIYGFSVGLAANGFFDIKVVQAILSAVGLGKKKVA